MLDGPRDEGTATDRNERTGRLQRDGRLRAAISGLIGLARQHGSRAVVIEDLDFTDAREQGRERHGTRPSRGRAGRRFRLLASGIPTGRFRDRLTQMAANAGLAVIAVDPAYTSRWGREHWLAPCKTRLPRSPPAITRPPWSSAGVRSATGRGER